MTVYLDFDGFGDSVKVSAVEWIVYLLEVAFQKNNLNILWLVNKRTVMQQVNILRRFPLIASLTDFSMFKIIWHSVVTYFPEATIL